MIELTDRAKWMYCWSAARQWYGNGEFQYRYDLFDTWWPGMMQRAAVCWLARRDAQLFGVGS